MVKSAGGFSVDMPENVIFGIPKNNKTFRQIIIILIYHMKKKIDDSEKVQSLFRQLRQVTSHASQIYLNNVGIRKTNSLAFSRFKRLSSRGIQILSPKPNIRRIIRFVTNI